MISDGGLDVFGIASTSGIGLGQYNLYLDPQTNAMGFSMNAFLCNVADLLWWFYRYLVGAVLWLTDQVVNFAWLDLTRDALSAVAAPIQQLIANVGLVPCLFAFGAVTIAYLFMRGRNGAGIAEMASTAIVLALLGGVLAHPVETVVGPDGILRTAQQVGLEAAAAVRNQPAGATSLPSAQLADIFVDLPTQLLSYGQQITPDCQSAWREALQKGPYPNDPDNAIVRGAVTGCSDKNVPSTGVAALGGVLVLNPSLWALLFISGVLDVALLLLCAIGARDAFKLVVALVRAVGPGDARHTLIHTLSSLGYVLVGIVTLLVGIAINTTVLLSVFQKATGPASAGGRGWNPWAAFLVVDLICLLSGLVFIAHVVKTRSAAKRLAENAHQALNRHRPAKLPSPSIGQLAMHGASTMSSVTTARSLRTFAGGSHGPSPAPTRYRPGGAGHGSTSSPSLTRALLSQAAHGSSPAAKAAGSVAGVAVGGGRLAVAAATGAWPAVAAKYAARAARSAARNKAALAARLHRAHGTS